MFFEYIFLYKFFVFCLLVVILLFSISFFLIYQTVDLQKVSSYECGFDPLPILELNLKLDFIS
jgi:NADH:ubiquinone oxidoreductase subunit 3 (subunit A)